MEGKPLRRRLPNVAASNRGQVTQLWRSAIDPREVSQAIKADGAVVLPELLDSDLLSNLNAEFDDAFTNPSGCVSVGEHPPGKMVSISTQQLVPGAFPAIASVFLDSTFEAIAAEVLATDFTFHDRIALTHEFHPTAITDIHFDMKKSLKCLLYLVDTDHTNGAFSFATGTHIENSRYRSSFLNQGGQLRDLLNVAAKTESIPLHSICAAAGTVIIFDTDVFHQGGTVEPGRERRVMRARSLYPGQPTCHRHKWGSRAWWRYKMSPPKTPAGYRARRCSRGRSRAA